jgi:DNA-directed RNA polymerase specialized sigma24 family protein
MRQPEALQATYQKLLRQYAAPLQRLAHAYARSPTEQEDLFQEIALALWTALPGFRGDASERTWLYPERAERFERAVGRELGVVTVY